MGTIPTPCPVFASRGEEVHVEVSHHQTRCKAFPEVDLSQRDIT